MRIYIIGGGASGIVAAITAARGGASVTILEQKDRIGKKILATGNGRCNLTNLKMDTSCFRGENLSVVDTVLAHFNEQDTLLFFEQLGMIPRMRDGYVYPRTDQASTVLELLEMELKRLHVRIQTNVRVTELVRTKKGFRIHMISTEGETQVHQADKVILASGGKASPAHGSDGSGYALAKGMGHTLVPVVPALVALRTKEKCFKKLAGVRTEAKVTLFVDGKKIASDTGELQLVNYGISGIPVFQISRYAAKGLYEKRVVSVGIDFLPSFSKEMFIQCMKNRIEMHKEEDAEAILTGIFHNKLIPVLLEYAHLNCNRKGSAITLQEIQKLSDICKNFQVQIENTNPFEQAQVCAGGVRTDEVNSNTMESVYVKNFYITGEILDVDGICGGYNLQWAWATGYLAGRNAALSSE